MVSFSYTKSNMPPRLEETFGSLGADWTVSSGTYAYASGGELVVKTQNSYSTYHRHWAKNAILFGSMKARFKMTGWTNPAKSRIQTNVSMYPTPDGVNRVFYCENPASPVVPGTLVVHSDTGNYVEGVDYDVLDYTQGKIQLPMKNNFSLLQPGDSSYHHNNKISNHKTLNQEKIMLQSIIDIT